MNNTLKLKNHRNAVVIALLVMNLLFGATVLKAQESMSTFVQNSDTLVVYKDVPTLPASDKYSIRVRSAATNNEWVNVFAHYTYNRAFELEDINRADGTVPPSTTTQSYANHTSGWSQSYGNIEMSKNTPVEVEIAAKNGFKIAGQDFFKATVHPAQKSNVATVVDGKVYFTITNPGQLVIDINGQMDDYNVSINPIGHPIHAISLFANPVIKKPTLDNARIKYVEPGSDYAALRLISTASFDTMYFKPGVHDIGRDFKIHPGKTYYIPGDAMLYGTLNNLDVPQGSYAATGENIYVYGYGTLSQAKISHPDYVLNSTGSYKSIEIQNGRNWSIRGVCIADPSHHSTNGTSSSNGLYSWMKVISWRANGDGLAGFGLTEDCFIRTQDDCSYAKGPKRRCTFWKDANAALFHLATIPENTVEPIIIEDCDVIYARLRSKGALNGGGFQQRGEGNLGVRNVNVIFRNFRVHDKTVGMTFFHLVSYQGNDAEAPTAVGASYKGFLFQNISIAGMADGSKQRILGCAEAPWYGGLIFDNITIGGVKITANNYTNYFETNKYVKYLLWGMPQNVTLTTNADASKGYVTRNLEQSTYLETTPVTITAVGKSGYVFSHWSGDYTGTDNPATVVVDKNMTITANFSDPDFSKPLTIDASGTGSFTIPGNVTSVSIQVWGGGGAGGSASNNATPTQSRGGGGAGGGFASVIRTVTAGQVLNYTLGGGGIAAPEGFANLTVDAVQNGGDSKVLLDAETIVLAQGGPGGQNIANAFASGTGGIAPQTGNIGDVVLYGGKGGTANSTGTGGGGGSAGSLGNGGNGGAATAGIAGEGGGAAGGAGHNATNVGNPGQTPGAGGSGAAVRVTANSTRKAGAGANGKIIFTFVLSPNSLENATELNAKIAVYPNPATDKIYINSNGLPITSIQLIDLSGRIIYSSNVVTANRNIEVSGFARGLYFVKIQSENNVITKKIDLK